MCRFSVSSSLCDPIKSLKLYIFDESFLWRTGFSGGVEDLSAEKEDDRWKEQPTRTPDQCESEVLKYNKKALCNESIKRASLLRVWQGKLLPTVTLCCGGRCGWLSELVHQHAVLRNVPALGITCCCSFVHVLKFWSYISHYVTQSSVTHQFSIVCII